MIPNNIGCWSHVIDSTGKAYWRIPYGGSGEPTDTPCGDCNVRGESFHHDGCDSEECPKCGEQFAFCECDWEKIANNYKEGRNKINKNINLKEVSKMKSLKKKVVDEMGKEYAQKYFVTSPSSGKQYITSRNMEGGYECSCPGWKFHSPRKDCKHCRAVQKYEAGEDAGMPVEPALDLRNTQGRQVGLSQFLKNEAQKIKGKNLQEVLTMRNVAITKLVMEGMKIRDAIFEYDKIMSTSKNPKAPKTPSNMHKNPKTLRGSEAGISTPSSLRGGKPFTKRSQSLKGKEEERDSKISNNRGGKAMSKSTPSLKGNMKSNNESKSRIQKALKEARLKRKIRH